MKFICGIVLGLVLAGVSGSAVAEEKPNGADIFKVNCVLCHGSDGHSQTALGKQLGALDLHSEQVQAKKDSELKNVILHGQKNMPGFEGQLSNEKVDAA